MKLATKISLIVAACLIAAGIVVAGISAALFGGSMIRSIDSFDYSIGSIASIGSIGSFGSAEPVENTHAITEAFDSISVDTAECDIRIASSSDGKCRVECREDARFPHTVQVENGTLTIRRDIKRDFDWLFGEHTVDNTAVTLYLPGESYEKLSLKTRIGSVSVPEGFSFRSADLFSVSGNVECLAGVKDELEVNTVSGDISLHGADSKTLSVGTTSGRISVTSVTSARTVTVSAISGDAELSDMMCDLLSWDSVSGDVKLTDVIAGKVTGESVNGDIGFTDCDADDLSINTVSGNVSGSLRSGKHFTATSVSGKVTVPPDGSGGRCSVSTISGNIRFETGPDEA